jgi:hypothetical protein
LHSESPAVQHSFTPGTQLCPQVIEPGGIGFTPGSYEQIPRRLSVLNILPPDFSQLPAQTIAGHRGRLELGDYQSHPWLARLVVHPDYIQVLEAAAPAVRQATANVRRACEAVGPRHARR